MFQKSVIFQKTENDLTGTFYFDRYKAQAFIIKQKYYKTYYTRELRLKNHNIANFLVITALELSFTSVKYLSDWPQVSSRAAYLNNAGVHQFQICQRQTRIVSCSRVLGNHRKETSLGSFTLHWRRIRLVRCLHKNRYPDLEAFCAIPNEGVYFLLIFVSIWIRKLNISMVNSLQS